MPDPDLDQLEKAKKVAELQKAISEAEKAAAENRKAVAEADAAAVKASLPDAAVLKPLEGKIDATEKPGIVAETAAYALFEGAAEAVAKLVTEQADGPPPPLDQPRAKAVPALAALTAIPSIVGAAADIAGYFQSNYSIVGRAFDAKTEPLLVALANAIAGTTTATVVVDGFHALRDTTIMSSYDTLLATRSEVVSARVALEQRKLATAKAQAERHKVELARREAELSAIEQAHTAGGQRDEAARDEAERRLESAREALHAAEATTADLQGLVEVAKAAEQRVDTFAAAVTTVPANGGLPPLGQAVFRDALHGAGSFSHVLYASVSSSGGETQIRQRRFFAPTVRYVGSCTISVLLARSDGSVVYAGSQALIGQLTYLIKDGKLGELRRVQLSSDPPG
jgi:hypothetical protein